MTSLILGIIFLLVCYIAIGVWHVLPFLLVGVIIGVIVGVIIHCIIMSRYKNAVIETEIIKNRANSKKTSRKHRILC